MAGIAGIVSAGLRIAVGLNEIVDTIKNALKELSYVAQQIQHLSELIGCTFQVIESNQHMYQDRLLYLLRDVQWQFKVIQDVVEKCLLGGKTGKQLRLLFIAKLIGDLRRKLEALKTTMTLTLQITQLADRADRVKQMLVLIFDSPLLFLILSRSMSPSSRIDGQQIVSLYYSARTSVKQSRRAMQNLIETEENPQIEDSKHLVKYYETPEDMVQWMAVTLSGTSLSLQQWTEILTTSKRFAQHPLNALWPSPEIGSKLQTALSSTETTIHALDRYNIPWNPGRAVSIPLTKR